MFLKTPARRSARSAVFSKSRRKQRLLLAVDQLGLLLRAGFGRLMIMSMPGRRHLQDGGALARCQPRDQNDLAARKLQRVMMDVRVFHVDLAETGDFVPDAGFAEQAESAVVSNTFLKCELGAGKQAQGRVGVAGGSKPRSEER